MAKGKVYEQEPVGWRDIVAGDLPSGSVSPLTTKGDVWGFSTVDARIPVGADGNVLTADSTQTLGVKWATASGSSPLTTKGDLFGHSTVDARIPVGTDGNVLTADSTQTLGVKWASGGGGGGGTGTAYGFIGSQTLGAAGASVSVGSIPATFSHLELVMALRGDVGTAFPSNPLIQFNGDTTAANYVSIISGAVGASTANITTFTASAGIACPQSEVTGSAANLFSALKVTIPLYASGSIHKSATSYGGRQGTEAGGAQAGTWVGEGTWKSTAAITSVTVVQSAALNWAIGSALHVYGIA